MKKANGYINKKHSFLATSKTSKTGITLIALVITIIVLLILAGVSISTLVGDNGILTQANNAKNKTNKENLKEQVQADILAEQMTNKNGHLTSEQLRKILDEYFNDVPETAEKLEQKLKEEPNYSLKAKDEKYGDVELSVADLYSGELEGKAPNIPGPSVWDNTNRIQTPNIKEGMIAKKINKETGEKTDVVDGETWYNYANNEWANMETEDGSMWVWIPRFEYKITEPEEGKNYGTIEINFIETDDTEPTDGYTIHPAFTSDTNQGGWKENIPGFWIAKYETSMEKKSGDIWQHEETPSANIGNVLTSNEIRAVSKPGVTSWRYIQIGNCYTNGYNYNRKLESHLIKNSEWGAVAYLTHSKYGIDGNKGNQVKLNSSPTYCTAGGEKTGEEKDLLVANKEQSTTGNPTGIYDLSGGTWEFVAVFNTTGSSLSYGIDQNGSNFTTKGSSTEYATAYVNKSNNFTQDGTMGYARRCN